jgi:hypothetical protein
VELLACGHAADAGSSRLCPDLIGTQDGEHVRLLTGHGLDADLCCRDCDRAAQGGAPVDLVVACEGCVGRCTDQWWKVVGWRGEPGIGVRPEPFDPTVTETPLPVAVADAAAVAAEAGSVWLLLAQDGRIGRFDADTGAWDVLARTSVPDETERDPWMGHRVRPRLHTDAHGRYAAVVNDFGRHGQILDLAGGAVTATLDGGDEDSETVPFSAAFTDLDGRPTLIHRSDWNRLDATDAATGQLLTDREPRPDHYLDYFHGRLFVSPGGRRIADDGWFWHPIGIPVVWDLRAWLSGNVWESEDGPTRLELCQRNYHWNAPMCWLDDERVAVSGIGGDDEAMLAGVRVFNAVSGVELATFPGPRGELFSDRARLYAAAPTGLEVWDPVTGERTGAIPGFVPSVHHTGSGELAELEAKTLWRWRIRP